MPTITIDGHQCEFEGKPSILQVALDNNIVIPHYCYHEGLSVVASCRICLAEVAQPNPRNDGKVELIPKLLPTCQTPAAQDAVVYTQSPKSINNQKAVMEYLLISHPLDCPVCDQAGECYLQDYSYKFGRSVSRYKEAKIKQPKKDIGDVLLYADRCIMCTRCVRFTKEVTGTDEIGVFGRGSEEQIDVFPGKPLDNELSGNVVDICPVGALVDKDFLMSMRVWNLQKAPSIDGLTASGDNISIEYNEDKIYRIKPRTNMEVNTWWTSNEIRYGFKFVRDEKRLRSPMHKKHGQLEPCSWQEAYSDIASSLDKVVQEKGEGHIAMMVSPMLASEEAFVLAKFARAVDPGAVIGVGPVPVKGEDKTFPGGYTVYAEKAPNARGVKRALELVADNVLDYDQLLGQIEGNSTSAVIVTGNYPTAWATSDLVDALKEKYTVLLDTLPNALTEQVDVLLPGATWAEKSGSFENVNHRIQSFQQAIAVIEMAKPEGQIALDLLAHIGDAGNQIYDDDEIRQNMGSALVSEVHHPDKEYQRNNDMVYAEI